MRGNPAAHALLFLVVGLVLFSPLAQAQSLQEAMEAAADSSQVKRPQGPPGAPWWAITGELVLGTAASAVSGYAVGKLSESWCDDCDATEPGGDLFGLIIGVPIGATLAVWFIGRLAPPSGTIKDTVIGALIGTAVFAGFSNILEDEGQAARWTGIIFPAALATVGWNKSRMQRRPPVSFRAVPGPNGPELAVRLTLIEIDL